MEPLRTCLFVATASLLLSGACADKVVTCGAHVQRLNCESGVIRVDSAFYGRQNSVTCAGGKTPEEVAKHSLLSRRRAGSAQDQKWCELNGNVFEDPCSDTFKYLETTFSCIPATHGVVCEHSMIELQCGQDEVIHMLGADFGRRDHTTRLWSERSTAPTIPSTCSQRVRGRTAVSCEPQSRCWESLVPTPRCTWSTPTPVNECYITGNESELLHVQPRFIGFKHKIFKATSQDHTIYYCNGLFTGLSKQAVKQLQYIQNAAARVLTRTRKYRHISPVLRSLHWLPVAQRIDFKTALLVFKSLHGLAPKYISDMLVRYEPSRTLRTSGTGLLLVSQD
ncbi:hypothetical protein WMY93_006857 [Mugilogobius chulae]|uniref:SUEL-type lectin domain-containing protein n=1 Tax=Mugilogobius chulae TaxID=88201 RepID=A0AAW0PNL0_9GOBI